VPYRGTGGTLPRVKIGITYNTGQLGTDPGLIAEAARHAEQHGFESFYVTEHIVLYPGAQFGAMQFPPDLDLADPLETLSFVAGVTERILLGTAVLLLPYRQPVLLAKQLATIDVLSRGRMRLLTIGIGVLPGEAAAVGVDFTSRGRRADEAMDALRLLWAGGPDGVSYDGEFFTLDHLVSYPKPVGGSLPIHVGGSSRAAARRAGLRGDGYFPGGRLTPQERASQLELMRATAEAAGRDAGALEYTRWGSIDLTPGDVADLAAQGVTRLAVGLPPLPLAELKDQLTALALRLGL
jgi:probable F420-dependent oxidoreductase